jgi:hypothetical protein
MVFEFFSKSARGRSIKMLNTTFEHLKRVCSGTTLLKFALLTLVCSCAGASNAADGDSLNKLSPAEKTKFVNAKFQSVTKVKALPAKVAEELGVSGKVKVMADVAEDWSEGAGPAAPRQHLIMAGIAGDRCFVYYEQGGIAHFEIMRIYKFSDKGASIVWEKRGAKRYETIAAVKEAMSKGELN